MDWTVYSAFVVASFILGVAPGPDNLFVLVQSATYGARAGLWVVAGLLTGLVIQTLLVALGVAAVVAASPMLFWAIKIAGACYLVYLAVMAWRAGSTEEGRTLDTTSALALWRRGVIMNITNPKVLIFFLAFFPQFLVQTSDIPVVVQMIVLGVTFMATTAVVFGGVALGAGVLADKLRTPKVQFFLNKTAAVIFVGLAIGTIVGA
ncbi:MAG: LysE family translocator [Sutterellaceae bacterium]|nr:LysE family translocator [Sutterellaceae bacterium]